MRTIAAILLLRALAPGPAPAWAAPAFAAQGAQAQMARSTSTLPSVEASTSAERQVTVSDLYNGARYRDPFAAITGASPAAAQVETLQASAAKEGEGAGEEEEPAFSIHMLNLKGVMKDPGGAAAILVHVKTGEGFILRGGRLYDYKNKRVENVTGSIQVKRKPAASVVTLMTPDKDVQILVLGEEEGGEPVKKSP